MTPATEHLVHQHKKYVSENPKEIEGFDSLYAHMLFYLTRVLHMDEKQAMWHIQDFRADMSCDSLNRIVKSEIIG